MKINFKKEIAFYNNFKKKLSQKEGYDYHEFRFAFKQCEGGTKCFTFYDPHSSDNIINYMGIEISRMPAWYHDPANPDPTSEFKIDIPIHSTDEAFCFELEEMGVIICVEEVDKNEVSKTPTETMNRLVNATLSRADANPFGVFDISSYSSYRAIEDYNKVSEDFREAFVQALQETK